MTPLLTPAPVLALDTATTLKAVALVIILLVFLSIAWRVFRTPPKVHDDAAQLPLDSDDAPVRTPRSPEAPNDG